MVVDKVAINTEFIKLGQLLNRHPHAQRFFFQIPELFQNFLLPDIL